MKKMATKVKLTALFLGVMACVGAAPANAAMVTVDKGTYDFTYNDGFWGIGLGTVFNATTLTFSDMGYQASTVGNRRGYTYSGYYDYGDPAVIVTPHSGYMLVDATSGFTGTYNATAGTAGTAYATEYSGIYSWWTDGVGNWAGSAASQSNNAGQPYSAPSIVSGSYDQSGLASLLGGATTPVHLYYTLSGGVYAAGIGSMANVTHDTSYFSFNVTPVPEPETWAMMMIGVTLVGFQLRKKNKETSSSVVKGMA